MTRPGECARLAPRVYSVEMPAPRELTAPPAATDQPASAAPERVYECDHCGKRFSGAPGGSGLLLWTRGDEVRYEEPPLCEECAEQITVGALIKWSSEDGDEEG